MHRIKLSMLSCVLTGILAALLLTTGVVEAASLSCGAWSPVKSPNPTGSAGSVLNGIAAVSPHNVWTVGSSDTGSPYPFKKTLIEHWNGSNWSIVPSPNPNGSVDDVLNGVTVVSANNVW